MLGETGKRFAVDHSAGGDTGFFWALYGGGKLNLKWTSCHVSPSDVATLQG